MSPGLVHSDAREQTRDSLSDLNLRMAQAESDVKQALAHSRAAGSAVPAPVCDGGEQLGDFGFGLHGGADREVDVTRSVGTKAQFGEFVVQVVEIQSFDGPVVVVSCEVLDEVVVAAGGAPAFDPRTIGGELGVAQLG